MLVLGAQYISSGEGWYDSDVDGYPLSIRLGGQDGRTWLAAESAVRGLSPEELVLRFWMAILLSEQQPVVRKHRLVLSLIRGLDRQPVRVCGQPYWLLHRTFWLPALTDYLADGWPKVGPGLSSIGRLPLIVGPDPGVGYRAGLAIPHREAASQDTLEGAFQAYWGVCMMDTQHDLCTSATNVKFRLERHKSLTLDCQRLEALTDRIGGV